MAIELPVLANLGPLLDQMQSYVDILKKAAAEANNAKGQMGQAFNESANQVEKFNGELRETISDMDQTSKKAKDLDKSIDSAFDPKEIEELRKEVEALKKQLSDMLGNTDKKSKSLKAELRSMKAELAKLEIQGKGNTKEFEELSKKAGVLEDQLGDVGNRVKVLASDSKYLDAFVQAGQGIAGGFAVAEGAIALFGEENEELQKTLVRLNAALAILNGLQSVAAALNKDSAARIIFLSTVKKAYAAIVNFVNNGLKKQVAQTVADTQANAADAVATTAAAKAKQGLGLSTLFAGNAMKFFRGALIATGVGIFIVIIGELIANFDKITEAMKGFMGITDDTAKKQRELAAALEYEGKILDTLEKQINFRAETQKLVNKKIKDDRTREIADLKIDLGKEAQLLEAERLRELLAVETSIKELQLRQKQKFREQIRAEQEARALGIVIQQDVIRANQSENRIIAANLKSANEQKAVLVKDYNDRRKALNESASIDIQRVEEKFDKDAAEKAKKAQEDRLRIKKEHDAKLLDLERKVRAAIAEVSTPQERIEEMRKAAQREVDVMVDELKRLGIFTAKQQEQVNRIRMAINERSARERIDLEFSQQNELNQIETDSNKQRIRDLEINQQQRRTKLQREGLLDVDAASALVNKEQQERISLNKGFALEDLDQQEQLANARADQFTDNSLSEEKNTRIRERKKLEIEMEFAQKRMQLLIDSGILTNQVEIEQIRARIVGIQQELGKLLQEERDEPIDLFELLGIKADAGQRSGIEKLAQDTVDNIKGIAESFFSFQIQKNKDLVSSLDDRISKQEEVLEREKELQQEGQANSLALEKQRLEALNQQRQQALEEQKRLQKQQLNLQAAEQASSLITATANIIAGFSTIPLVGQILSVAAIAAMFTSFAQAQVIARKSVSSGVELEKGGPLLGPSHKKGGMRIEGTNITVEGGEFVTNKKSYAAFPDLVEAINNSQLTTGALFDINKLLDGTGVTLAPDVPERVIQTKTTLRSIEKSTGGSPELQRSMDDLIGQVAGIRSDMKNRTEVTDTDTHKIIKKGNHVTRIKKRKNNEA